MPFRQVTLQLTAKLNTGFYISSVEFVQRAIQDALNNDSWQIIGLNVTGLLDTYNIRIIANVNNAYNDPFVQARVQQIISGIESTINYGILTGSPFKLFSSVSGYVISDSPVYQTNADAVKQQGFLYDQAGLDGTDLASNLGLGLGLSTPVVIGIGALLLFLYIKK